MSHRYTSRLTVPETAERLRCCRERVLRLIRSGRLRAINTATGNRRPRWIVDEADLERFEKANANAPAVIPMSTPRRQRGQTVPNYFA